MTQAQSFPTAEKESFLMYKGKPLVRCGNVVYYGNISDKYVIQMEMKNPVTLQDMEVSTIVSVTMLETNSESGNIAKIIKSSEKPGLYPAMDIAQIWLSRVEV